MHDYLQTTNHNIKHVCVYIYIYIYIVIEHKEVRCRVVREGRLVESHLIERELEYRMPRLHPPENSRRFPETFGDFRKNITSFLWVFVENRFLMFAPIDFR